MSASGSLFAGLNQRIALFEIGFRVRRLLVLTPVPGIALLRLLLHTININNIYNTVHGSVTSVPGKNVQLIIMYQGGTDDIYGNTVYDSQDNTRPLGRSRGPVSSKTNYENGGWLWNHFVEKVA